MYFHQWFERRKEERKSSGNLWYFRPLNRGMPSLVALFVTSLFRRRTSSSPSSSFFSLLSCHGPRNKMATSSSQSALRIASGGGAYARLDLTHSLYPGRRWAEIVFGQGSTISEAKDKIYKHTGTLPENMQVYLCFPGGSEETSSAGGGGGRLLLANPTMTLG